MATLSNTTKALKVTEAFAKLVQEYAREGKMDNAQKTLDAMRNLPDDTKLKLYNLLTEIP